MSPWLSASAERFAAFLAVVLAYSTAFGTEPPMSNLPMNTSDPVYGPIPGKAVGVLVLDPRSVLAAERRFGPEDAAAFSYDGKSCRWLYLPAPTGVQGESNTFGVDAKGEKRVGIDDLVLGTRKALRDLGVAGEYALVEVTVNGGAGSAPEESFAATGLRIVEGTPEFPLKVADVVRRLERDYRTALGKRADVGKALDAAKAQVAADEFAGEHQSQTMTGRRVTWLPERQILRVEFRSRMVEGKYLFGKGTESSHLPDSAEETEKGKRYGIERGVTTGSVYEVSKAGKVQSQTSLRVVPVEQRIGPPESAPPGPPAVPAPASTTRNQ